MKKQNMTDQDILDYVAISDIVSLACGQDIYVSEISVMPAGSWQIDVLKKSASVCLVMTYEQLKKALHDPEGLFILIPKTAFLTRGLIESLCRYAPFVKNVIIEE